MVRLILLLAILLSPVFAGKIVVAAAANTAYAMEEIVFMFKKEYIDTKVDLIIGSSGKMAAQIKNGAPYDIFLSADMKYPLLLHKDELSIAKPEVYAKGALVIFTLKDLDLSKGLMLLKEDGIKRVAVANHKLAPYGKAALEAMKNAGVLSYAKKKFINAESVTQTLQYTMTAADMGFVAKSSMFSKKLSDRNVIGKNWVDVNPALYEPIEQGIVLLRNANGNEDAKRFYDFIFSNKAKAVFEKYGYMI